jgi:PKD repeat protein
VATHTRRVPLLAPITAIALVAASLLAPTAALADTSPDDSSTPSTVSSDALPTVQVDGVVWAQKIVGNTVFVGGDFTTAQPAGAAAGVGSVARTDLLAYNLQTGELISSFAPTLNGQVRAIEASPDGSRIYIGGDFSKVNASGRTFVAALNPTTGAVITTFKPVVNGPVYSLAANGGSLFLGGNFTSINSTTRTRAAKVDAAGVLAPFSPAIPDGTVRAMVVSPDGSKVVVGGSFGSVNGSTSPGQGLASVDGTTAASLPWAIGNLVYDHGTKAAIYSLATDGTNVYGTGYVFGSLADGNLEGSFNASFDGGKINWVEDCHGDTYSVAPMDDAVYIASHSHQCVTVPDGYAQTEPTWTVQRSLAFSKKAVGFLGHNVNGGYYDFYGQPAPDLLAWYPDLTIGSYTGAGQAAWSVAAGSGYVLLGGEFTAVNGKRQTGLTRFAVKSIAPNTDGPRIGATTATVWQPNAVSLGAGSVRVSWITNWDRDNARLTYKVYRNGGSTPVYTTSAISRAWWLRPQLGFVDSGLTPGAKVSYTVVASDPFGNSKTSAVASATVSSSTAGSSGYSAAVQADGASDFWRFGEASGSTVYDWTGYNDLAAGSGVSYGATGPIVGDPTTAATFSGASDASGLAATTTPVAGPNTFSVEGWFKTTSTAGGKIVGFGNANSGNSSSYDRHVYMNTNGQVLFGVYPGFSATVQTSGAYNDGKWHYVVASLSSGGMQLFLDGKRAASRSDVTTGQAYSGYWRVGGDSSWSGGNYFAGSVADVAVYPTALSATAVKNHWNASGNGTASAGPADAYGARVYQDQPDLYWRLGDAAGATTAADASGNGDAGSVQGGVTFGRPGAVRGTTDTAAGFNGSNGLVVASQAVTDPEIYSEELWFRTSTTSGGKLIGFGDGTSGTSGSYDRHVWMLDDGRLSFGTWTGQTNIATSNASYNDGKWHQMVATQSGAGLQLDVDGQNVASNPQTQAQSYTGYWRIGGDTTWGGNSSSFFAGDIDDVAVYSYALSAQQIADHAALGSSSINAAPTAAFSATTDGLLAHLDGSASADSDGTVASYAWDFGDGKAGTGATPDHTYAAAGSYQVQLTVTDDRGATGTITKTVTVAAPNKAPTAAFTATATGRTVSVDGSASTDTDGTVASYAWDFGDGGSAKGATASHDYTADGTYTVKLTVTDDDGATDTTTKSVSVARQNQAPTAGFTTSTSGRTVSVDGTSSSDSDGSVSSYAWSFGDGGSGTGATASHTYTADGTYTVTLTVTDDAGATDTTTKSVSVSRQNQSPTAGFTASASGRVVSVDASASADPDGSISSYAWAFGDGATGTGKTTSHTFAADGTYTVTLTVTDDSGASATSSKSVTVASALAKDSFARTVTSGLGTADVGGVWTTPAGAANLSVASGTARFSDKAGITLSSYLNGISQTDVDAQATATIDRLPAGGSAYLSLVGRRVGTSDYSARAVISSTGTVSLAIMQNDSTSLARVGVSGLTVAPGTALKMRLQVSGTSPTTIRAKIWNAANAEPTAWQTTTTDTTAALQSAGSVGLRTYMGSGLTNAPVLVTWDDYTVVPLP